MRQITATVEEGVLTVQAPGVSQARFHGRFRLMRGPKIVPEGMLLFSCVQPGSRLDLLTSDGWLPINTLATIEPIKELLARDVGNWSKIDHIRVQVELLLMLWARKIVTDKHLAQATPQPDGTLKFPPITIDTRYGAVTRPLVLMHDDYPYVFATIDAAGNVT